MGFMVPKSLLVASSLLLSCFTIESWILRLTCKNEADFIIVVRDFILKNNIVGRHTTTDHLQCIVECVRNSNCKSLNYYEIGGNENCELNGNIKERAEADFKPKAGWVYHSTDYNTTNIGSVCETLNPCKGQYCVDTCSQNGFRCFQCDNYHEMRLEQNCELKTTKNIALQKSSAGASAVYSRPAARGNDGNVEQSPYLCFASTTSPMQWWQVDLEAPALILKVNINIPNKDGYTIDPFDIRAGMSGVDGGHQNPFCVRDVRLFEGEVKNFTCPSYTIARYVSIHVTEKRLRLCEVEVYGIYSN